MRKLYFFILTLLISFSTISAVFAQEDLGLGIARTIKVDESVENGDIISVKENKFLKSNIYYDPGVVGVIVEKPALALDSGEGEGTYYVISSGVVKVKVSTLNGNIGIGDVITTSEKPGVGVKLTRSGFALGIAKEPFSSNNTDDIGFIKVDVQRHYAYTAQDNLTQKFQRSLTDVLILSEIATYDSPTQVLRYLLAGIVVITAIVIGISTFGKIARAGVEAIGRNPLASSSINVGIIFNVLITLAIIAAGIGVGYLIIVF